MHTSIQCAELSSITDITKEAPGENVLAEPELINSSLRRKDMLEITGQRNSKTTTWLIISAVSLLLAFAAPIMSRAQESKQDRFGHATGQEVKIPQTVQDHLDLAERYQKKAAEYRQEIDIHKKMLSEYSKGVARLPKDTSENPYIRKMRLHCEKYSAAENLAREADEMARFHTFRARELEGK
jgi:hypothetical protein